MEEDNNNNKNIRIANLREMKGPKIKLSVFVQVSAIVSKEYILWSRSKISTLLKYLLIFIIGYIYSSFSELSCFLPLLIGVTVSIFESKAFTEQMANDKELNFRTTFKLMGLSDTSYFMGNYIFRISSALSILGTFLLASAVTYRG